MSISKIARVRFNHTPYPFRLYRVGRVAKLFDVDKSTVWRWKKTGVLPPPAAIFPGFEAWTEEQIQEVIKRHRQEDH